MLNAGYVVVEGIYGLSAGSLGLLADAGHNLSDVLSLAAAFLAHRLARRPPTERFTYGFKRSPILASLFNAMLLLLAMGAIAYEAVHRLVSPAAVSGTTIIWVAAVGVAVNTGTALMFMRGSRGDLNLRGAFLHMAADAGVTVGVLLAGVGVSLTMWRWLDPAVSLLVVAVVLWSTWGLLDSAVRMSLDAAPSDIDPEEVRAFLARREGVDEVHDLHIWPLSTTETALTAHLVMPEPPAPNDGFLSRTCGELAERFGIRHSTLQLERGDPASPCGLAESHVV